MGVARKMVHEAAIGPKIGTLRQFPGLPTIEEEEKQPERVPFSWAQRRLLDLGVLVMPESPQTPGININWTTITGIIALCVFIGSLFAFTWSVAHNMGMKEAELQQMRERIATTEKKAEQADTKATYAVSGADEKSGHKPEKEKK